MLIHLIHQWGIEPQRRAWVMAVAASSAMDTRETQALMARWVAKGALSDDQWERMRQLAEYTTSPQYIDDEVSRKTMMIRNRFAKNRAIHPRGILARMLGR